MDSDSKIISLRFNQDQGCFSCCMESGIRIYNVEPLVEKSHYDLRTVGSVSRCEMLYRTNLLAIVAGGSRPKFSDNILLIFDDIPKKFILKITFPASIGAVRLRKDKIVVALTNCIHVFSFPSPTRKLFSMDTRNPRGLCELSSFMSSERQILIFPGYKLGSIQIVDLACVEVGMSCAPVCIDAHTSEIGCLTLNLDATRIASASIKGTLIRIWDVQTRTQLLELRRGTDVATIYCMNFSRDSDYLCCSSDKGTVHIFAVKNTLMNTRMSMPMSGILGHYGTSQWAFANFTVKSECACICAFVSNSAVVAICIDGTFHKYNFSNKGCNREAFDKFLDVCDDDDNFM